MKLKFRRTIISLLFSVAFLHKAFCHVPIVDFNAEDAPIQFYQSLKNTGFAVIKNHTITPQLLREIQEEWTNFYLQPIEEKKQFAADENTGLGYFYLGAENAEGSVKKNEMEFFHYALKKNNIPDALVEKTRLYLEAMLEMGKTLFSWLDQAIQEQERESGHPIIYNNQKLTDVMSTNRRYTIMRSIHYPGCAANPEDTEINIEHTDISLLSLLFATKSGLQVKDSDGNWHNLGGDADSMVVNAGDMLKHITSGHIQSTVHRVIRIAGDTDSRSSYPVFIGAKPNTIVGEGKISKNIFAERMRNIGVTVEAPNADSDEESDSNSNLDSNQKFKFLWLI
jgi:isopenicillin N synthase-like dioxygenase